jgi:tetratricopeptide (TPR) repeat protein
VTRPKTNICLNMIVKNETAVLPRLFASLKDYIDYYVIVDTGSTDGTIELIKSEMTKYGIFGEVHRRPWVNFGVNRQQALELAVKAERGDWALFIDADEELGVSDPLFYEKLEPGISYDIEKHHAGTRYAVPHLINIRTAKWKWEGPVHNYLVHVEGPKQRKLLSTVWIIYHSGQGAKSHGVTPEEKYLRDAKLLEEDLVAHPDNARSQFYLGQSYKHAGHHQKAYEAYQKRVTMTGWAEETFMAQLEVGRVAILLALPDEIVLKELLAAYDLRPTRAEPLHDLARHFRQKKAYGKAYMFSKIGADTPRPKDYLFVSQEIYDWRLLDELGVAAYWVGRYAESKAACEEVLRRIDSGLKIPEADAKRLKDNVGYANTKLGL